MKHLYRILAHGRVDVVAADTPQQALGLWESQRVGQCDPEADTAQVEQVPVEEVWAYLVRFPSVASGMVCLDDVLMHLGGTR